MSDHNITFAFNNTKEEALFTEVCKVYEKYSAIGFDEHDTFRNTVEKPEQEKGNIISKNKLKEFFKTRLRK